MLKVKGVGGVFFRAPTFDAALTVLGGLASSTWFTPADVERVGRLRLPLMGLLVVGLGALHVAATALTRAGWKRGRAWQLLRPVAWFAVIVACLLFADSGAQQFIYFQF